MNILEVRNLKTYFYTEKSVVKAVDGVDLDLREGEVLGIVGESGSGKSVMVMSIMNLISSPGKIVDGTISYKGENLRELTERQMRDIRGNKISMIYQNPMTSLNPRMTVGKQIEEVLKIKRKDINKKDRKKLVLEAMKEVGIVDYEKRYYNYPKEFSGGMRQRIVIAMAIVSEPDILIADEPTTALDLTIQRDILNLLLELRDKKKMSIIFITHDLGVIWDIADRVNIMYLGKVLESTTKEKLFKNPLNPYTKGLLKSIPRSDIKEDKLYTIRGTIEDGYKSTGCRFYDRCSERVQNCKDEIPRLLELEKEHFVRCFLYEKE